MAKTFGAYMMECEIFEHSKEFYDIIKESNELDLMTQWLSNQEFLENNKDELTQYVFVEGYFIEEELINDKQEVEGQMKQKAESLFGRISNGVKYVFNVIIKFFAKLLGRMINKNKSTAEGISNIDFNSLSHDQQNDVTNAIKTAWQNSWEDKFQLSRTDDINGAKIFEMIKTGKFTVYPRSKAIGEDMVISIEDFNTVIQSINKAFEQAKLTKKIKADAVYTVEKAVAKNVVNLDISDEAFKKAQEDLRNGIASCEKMQEQFRQELQDNPRGLLGKAGKVVSWTSMIRMLIGGANALLGGSIANIVSGSILETLLFAGSSYMWIVFMAIGFGINMMTNSTKYRNDIFAMILYQIRTVSKNLMEIYNRVITFQTNALQNILKLNLKAKGSE